MIRSKTLNPDNFQNIDDEPEHKALVDKARKTHYDGQTVYSQEEICSGKILRLFKGYEFSELMDLKNKKRGTAIRAQYEEIIQSPGLSKPESQEIPDWWLEREAEDLRKYQLAWRATEKAKRTLGDYDVPFDY